MPPKRRGRGEMLRPRAPQRVARWEWAQNASASVLGRPEAAVACILSTLVSQNTGGTPVYTSQLAQILCGKPDLEGGPRQVSHANPPGALSPVWGRLEPGWGYAPTHFASASTCDADVVAPRPTCSGVLLGAAFPRLLLGASLGRRPDSLPERGRAGGASPPHVPRTSRRRPSTCSPEVGGAPLRRLFTHVGFVLVKLAGLRPGPSSRTWHSAPGSSPRPTLRASRRRNPRFVLVKLAGLRPGPSARRLRRGAP